MNRRLRKAALTVHIAVSVGWAGAVAAVLALAVIAAASSSERTATAANLVMAPVLWSIVVPLSVASLATGVVCALGTPWGLLRHYWIIAKLTINIVATAVLLLYTRTVDALSAAATGFPELPAPRSPSPVIHAVAALLLLLLATGFAVFKPKGQRA